MHLCPATPFLPASKSMIIIPLEKVTVNSLLDNPTMLVDDPTMAPNIAVIMASTPCPCCGKILGLSFYCCYRRNLYNSITGGYVEITIPVYKCNDADCPHPYHAIIPDVISPYKSYTYDDILTICKEYQNSKCKEVYAESIGITSRTIRKWISTLKAQSECSRQSCISLYEYTWKSLQQLIKDLQSGNLQLFRFLDAFYRNNLVVFHQGVKTAIWHIRYDTG